jgi:hypothetical protein
MEVGGESVGQLRGCLNENEFLKLIKMRRKMLLACNIIPSFLTFFLLACVVV